MFVKEKRVRKRINRTCLNSHRKCRRRIQNSNLSPHFPDSITHRENSENVAYYSDQNIKGDYFFAIKKGKRAKANTTRVLNAN